MYSLTGTKYTKRYALKDNASVMVVYTKTDLCYFGSRQTIRKFALLVEEIDRHCLNDIV